MSFSNSPMSILDEDKVNSERFLALKYIKEREERASTVENILAPITPQDEFIFDIPRGENDSEVSELSDPFAELGENIILSVENKTKRRLSKVEADTLVMNSFPKSHMDIQNELTDGRFHPVGPHIDIQKILEAKIEVESEAKFEIWKILQNYFLGEDDEVLQSVAASLDQCGLKTYLEDKRKKDDKELRKQKKKVKTGEDQLTDLNSLSGIWRMLDATSVENDFPITQAGYHFYEDNEAWIQPGEKTWNQKEEIRKKCEDWLKDVKQQ